MLLRRTEGSMRVIRRNADLVQKGPRKVNGPPKYLLSRKNPVVSARMPSVHKKSDNKVSYYIINRYFLNNKEVHIQDFKPRFILIE